MCYALNREKGERKHEKRVGVFVADPFGPDRLDTQKEEVLCVPSERPPAELAP